MSGKVKYFDLKAKLTYQDIWTDSTVCPENNFSENNSRANSSHDNTIFD